MGPKTMVYEPLPEANLHHVAFTLSNVKMWMPISNANLAALHSSQLMCFLASLSVQSC